MNISVIMTCHNEEQYIEQAVRSVVNQTAYDKIGEIIFVNDGSTDGSAQLLSRLSQEIKRMTIINLTGVGSAQSGHQSCLRRTHSIS